ncbi:MAG: exodeoxyribonuclease VII small subunit [Acidimicrobiales bacterium]
MTMLPPGSNPDTDLGQLSYEDLLARLEDLTRQISSGDIGIEQAADLYEEAGRVHAAAAARLEQVRTRIENLQTPPTGNRPEPPPEQDSAF